MTPNLNMSDTGSPTEHKDYLPLETPSRLEIDLDQPATDRALELQDTKNDNSTSKGPDNLGLSRTKSIAETLSPVREFLFVGLLCSAQLVTQVGLLNTLNILHIIGSDLGITNPGVLSWLVAGYSLTVGTFILLSGRCGDLFGYKTMVIIGFAWFAIWNVVAGCSVYASGRGGQVLFIFSRVLGGVGPAILLPNALGLLGATYDSGRRKDMVFSLFGACAPGGAVVGGTFAGLWSLLWWTWTFWTFGITLAILAILSTFILPSVPLSPELRSSSYKEKLAELDLLGASVGITAMILFNFAINQAPGFGWYKVYIYVLLIVGILLFPIFFWIELKVAKNPLIPFDALSTDVSFVLVCEACGWAAFGTSTSSVPQTIVMKTNIDRNLGLLLHTNPATAQRRLALAHHGAYLPRRHLWLIRSPHNRPRHFAHWPRLGHAYFHVGFSCRLDTNRYDANRPSLLETGFHRHAHYALGHGHEFSRRHVDHERRGGEETSGHGSEPGQYYGQL
jgi:MFS family permease